jgi:iron complex transport system ATP-binding protein
LTNSQKNNHFQVVALENVTLKRKEQTLISKVNWEILPGQNWVLLGPNGAGKTLLLRLITGYLWPTEGQITVLGHILGKIDLRSLRRKIGWVSQALADLMPQYVTLKETILSGPTASLGLYDEPDQDMVLKAEELALEFGLHDKLNRPFNLLSSGERQRTLLARAALMEPQLLILDEPMSNLDLGGRELFIKLLGKLAEKPNPPSLILTTHNTMEIGSFINRAILVKDGKVLTSGTLDNSLNSDWLSQLFELPLIVEKNNQGRIMAYMVP